MKENLKKDLYNYLDSFTFVNNFEVLMAINEFFKPHGEPTSWGDVVTFWDIANDYIMERGLEFED